jgi:hypothetical protein
VRSLEGQGAVIACLTVTCARHLVHELLEAQGAIVQLAAHRGLRLARAKYSSAILSATRMARPSRSLAGASRRPRASSRRRTPTARRRSARRARCESDIVARRSRR